MWRLKHLNYQEERLSVDEALQHPYFQPPPREWVHWTNTNMYIVHLLIFLRGVHCFVSVGESADTAILADAASARAFILSTVSSSALVSCSEVYISLTEREQNEHKLCLLNGNLEDCTYVAYPRRESVPHLPMKFVKWAFGVKII